MSADTKFFTEYSIESAPPAARRFMTATRDHLGYLPAGMARMAASPQLMDGFLRLTAIFENTTLEPVAREVVLGIGTYTMSTLANRLTGAPVDDQLAAYAWALSCSMTQNDGEARVRRARSADVEDAETQGHADAGDDPEADHDGGLGPA